jgi:hypothetical protein
MTGKPRPGQCAPFFRLFFFDSVLSMTSSRHIDRLIFTERALWPSDTLPLIPQTRGVAPSPATGTARGTGLSGVSHSHNRSNSHAQRACFYSPRYSHH